MPTKTVHLEGRALCRHLPEALVLRVVEEADCCAALGDRLYDMRNNF
jgi:hypothetical protein